jgi:hypothetical protein
MLGILVCPFWCSAIGVPGSFFNILFLSNPFQSFLSIGPPPFSGGPISIMTETHPENTAMAAASLKADLRDLFPHYELKTDTNGHQ